VFADRLNSLEAGSLIAHTLVVDRLSAYSKEAMKRAKVSKLGDGEGYVARIPGFRGLLATGATRKESLAELQDALVDWIELSLRRGTGLPAIKDAARTLSAA
jgi:predicted RNase H-like HicB family nuclease